MIFWPQMKHRWNTDEDRSADAYVRSGLLLAWAGCGRGRPCASDSSVVHPWFIRGSTLRVAKGVA